MQAMFNIFTALECHPSLTAEKASLVGKTFVA
jgi:hypothetical protein